jgi:hypothetical protein
MPEFAQAKAFDLQWMVASYAVLHQIVVLCACFHDQNIA